MVAVAAVGKRAYVFTASFADERHVLVVSADGSRPPAWCVITAA